MGSASSLSMSIIYDTFKSHVVILVLITQKQFEDGMDLQTRMEQTAFCKHQVYGDVIGDVLGFVPIRVNYQLPACSQIDTHLRY